MQKLKIQSAIVIGATGLVGRQLVEQLLLLPECQKITLVVRREQPQYRTFSQIQQLILDDFLLLNEEDVSQHTHAFSCLGTTLKQAGSRQAFYDTDYTINMHFAELLQDKHIHYVLVSAAGASASSHFFYNRVKGELERDVQAFNLDTISILRPSLLIGERSQSRFFEGLSQKFFHLTERFLPAHYTYKPVTASQVAKTMVAAAMLQTEHIRIYNNLDIQNTTWSTK
ncbi:NAD-dependent epimerase/dehydratase family protein [Acinetobacter sp. MB5]|uniref:NAD-dependent epimerase/dehydratase family protein n=1 Tax=Acinetobacter sp. MB5 TaxID=2069438 RepID=UPI000DD05586|nr:NAD(P)H-binding protein [Acinetobacter sp. MB5]